MRNVWEAAGITATMLEAVVAALAAPFGAVLPVASHTLLTKQLPRQYPPFATVPRALGWLPGNAHGESSTLGGAQCAREWTYRDGLQHLVEHVEADDHDRSGLGDCRADRGVELRLADVVALHFSCFVGRGSWVVLGSAT